MVQQPSVTSRKDSTTNIHRRYRHLFTLPARNRTLVYASLVILITAFLSREGSGYPLGETAGFLVLTEFVLLASIEIDRRVLKGRNKIATYRRLASLTIASNSFWLALTFVGYVLMSLTSDFTRLFSLVILGALFSTSFRALILGSLFYDRHTQAIPLSFVQPGLLFIPIGFQFRMLSQPLLLNQSLGPIFALIGGLVALIGMEIYLSTIERIRISIYRPLELLQAFLNAWAAEDATNLERFLDITSKDAVIDSKIIEFYTTNGKSATVILPGVHPGPFYPIGSSNIPADIYLRLRSAETIPMVVHSLSDHGLNLPSKTQVERYIEELKNQRTTIGTGKTMTFPIVKKIRKATVTGIAFGSTVCIMITQAPYGMEDFPVSVREDIESYSKVKGFENSLVIDTHNSEGEKPNLQECSDAISAAKEVVDQLSIEKQWEFDVGMAHSTDLKDRWVGRDVGPAGIGIIVFKIKDKRYTISIVDSNNAALGFREHLFVEFLKSTGSEILELCTSDTHVTAAKTSDAKGYLALGDVMTVDKFNSILVDLSRIAEERLSSGSFSSFWAQTRVKTIGGDVLDDFSGLLDSASSEAKHGARILGSICLAITIIVALI